MLNIRPQYYILYNHLNIGKNYLHYNIIIYDDDEGGSFYRGEIDVKTTMFTTTGYWPRPNELNLGQLKNTRSRSRLNMPAATPTAMIPSQKR